MLRSFCTRVFQPARNFYPLKMTEDCALSLTSFQMITNVSFMFSSWDPDNQLTKWRKGMQKKTKTKNWFFPRKKKKKTFEGWRRQSIPPITLTVAGGIAWTETETKINCTSEKLYVDRLFTPRKSCWMKIIFENAKSYSSLRSCLSISIDKMMYKPPAKKIKHSYDTKKWEGGLI